MELTDKIKGRLSELWTIGDNLLYQNLTKQKKRQLSKQIHKLHDNLIESILEA